MLTTPRLKTRENLEKNSLFKAKCQHNSSLVHFNKVKKKTKMKKQTNENENENTKEKKL